MHKGRLQALRKSTFCLSWNKILNNEKGKHPGKRSGKQTNYQLEKNKGILLNNNRRKFLRIEDHGIFWIEMTHVMFSTLTVCI